MATTTTASLKTEEYVAPLDLGCIHCDQSFNTQIAFINHMKAAHDYMDRIEETQRYQCKFCDRSFHEKQKWTEHHRSHTGERPFKCTQCSKAYPMRYLLLKHIRREHDKERRYECSVCSKRFFQRIDWTRHCRIHTGERPYKCDICSQAFSTRSNMIAHRRIHTGEKPYQCMKCLKRYRSCGNRNKHERQCQGSITNIQGAL